jgi:hypothetical protein
MNYRTALLATAATLALSASAIAAPITFGSQLNISGFNQAVGGTSLDTATGLDFTDGGGAPSPGTAGTITSYSGTSTFAGLSCNASCGLIQDLLDFTSFVPTNNFYTTTAGVAFDLDAITNITRIPSDGGSLPTLIVSGTGQFEYDGFDDTPAIFTLTTQGGTVTTFSASTVAQAVAEIPAPANFALLGFGLLGLGMAARNRKAG